jgi:hypothetical protein
MAVPLDGHTEIHFAIIRWFRAPDRLRENQIINGNSTLCGAAQGCWTGAYVNESSLPRVADSVAADGRNCEG